MFWGDWFSSTAPRHELSETVYPGLRFVPHVATLAVLELADPGLHAVPPPEARGRATVWYVMLWCSQLAFENDNDNDNEGWGWLGQGWFRFWWGGGGVGDLAGEFGPVGWGAVQALDNSLGQELH